MILWGVEAATLCSLLVMEQHSAPVLATMLQSAPFSHYASQRQRDEGGQEAGSLLESNILNCRLEWEKFINFGELRIILELVYGSRETKR